MRGRAQRPPRSLFPPPPPPPPPPPAQPNRGWGYSALAYSMRQEVVYCSTSQLCETIRVSTKISWITFTNFYQCLLTSEGVRKEEDMQRKAKEH
jgi:hypothetical protein